MDVDLAEYEDEMPTFQSASYSDLNKSSSKDDNEKAVAEDRFDDPANWPNVIDDATRVALVK